MIHQVSGGADGHIEDMSIRFKETQAVNELWIQELSKCTGKKVAQIRKDMNRDYYMSAEEAKTYGIVDAVLDKRELR